jgi:ornithine--oxo-acid transaminase
VTNESYPVYGTFSSNLTNVNPLTGKVLRYLHAEDYAEVFEKLHERIAGVIMEPLHGTSRWAILCITDNPPLTPV